MRSKRELIIRIDMMIRMKNTGTADEFAKKLEISRSSLFEILKEMKDTLNAPIIYNSPLKRYEYTIEGQIFLEFLSYKELVRYAH